MNLSEQIRSTPMRGFQWGVIALCILLTALEGYEIIMMSLLAPTLAKEWSLTPVVLGYLFSSSILGMALGSVFLAPIADRIGRRKHILVCLIFTAIAMALCGLAHTVPTLLAARAFSGLWLGAIIPTLTCCAAEAASDRQRGLVMGIYGTGLSIGSMIGGLTTGAMIGLWGWQGPFFVSAALSAFMACVVYLLLPESVEYLVQRRPSNALREYNKIAVLLKHPLVAELPPARGLASNRGSLHVLFTGTLLKRTIVLWSAYGLVIAAFYFSTTWTPKLIADATGDASSGRMAAVFIALGAIVGTLGFGALAAKWSGRLVASAMLLLALPIYLAFASYHTTEAAKVLTVLLGMVTIGGVSALYAISPFVYPTAHRGTAIGFMMGYGRSVSVIVPIAMGYLLQNGLTPKALYQFFGVLVLVAGLLVYCLHLSYRGRSEDPELVTGEDKTPQSGAEEVPTAVSLHRVPDSARPIGHN